MPGSEIYETLLFCFLFEEALLPPGEQDWAQTDFSGSAHELP